ncbi:hypothetical protein [Bifidobacterium sp. ESL0745]|uniref:hypothetical protein n=1 Tax=Bifidobacterium sp. ESL0745 TaxID=2983226 RepID=UPI0023F9B3C5|nr:hypothetical protein [Bifidobacterium sp. ESL0745]MDF7665706.1 hypothetical protein [Bifidobacterium sp. ESL0745]
MSVLNYTTSISAEKTKSEIVNLLTDHGASRITVINDPDGLEFEYRGLWYRVPADSRGVLRLLEKERNSKAPATPKHARMVAWRTLRQWIQAQLAIIEAGMADLDQVMLPYLLDDNRRLTTYDAWKENRKQIGQGEKTR